MPRAIRLSLLAALLCCVLPGAGDAAGAPADRELTGTVEDASGGALAGARVRVACGAVDTTVVSDGAGRFRVAGLPAAVCQVDAARELFSAVRADVDLSGRAAAHVRLILPLAGLATEIVVTPARGEAERAFDVPQSVSVTTRAELESRPHHLLVQALREEPGVLVQQTTTAQGSPFIRGFSAQRIVYLVEGVRLNTAIFRAGATQYLGWVPATLVDHLEVVRGPSSVQYGSDALGGTINVISLQPQPRPAGPRTYGSLQAVFGSADAGAGGEADVTVAGRHAAVRAGGAARRVGELRTGGGRDSRSALTRFLGLRSNLLYTRLPGTGFSQRGAHVAATVRAGTQATLSGLYLHEEQLGVQRYDRLLGGDGLHRSDFAPQALQFGYARYRRGRTGFLDDLSGAFSFNRQRDDQIEQAEPGSAAEIDRARVTAFGYQLQGAWTVAGRHSLSAGAEAYDEHIDASRTIDDPADGPRAVRAGLPDGGRYTSAGVFVQHGTRIASGRLSTRGGLRYGHFLFRAPAPLPEEEAPRVPASAGTFHAAVIGHVTPAVNASLSVSRGFRAANAHDLGAIGIGGGGFELAPAQAAALGAAIGSSDGADATTTGLLVRRLAPEAAYALEGGVKVRTVRVAAAVSVFDLQLADVIQRRAAIFPPATEGAVVAGHRIVLVDEEGRGFIAADPRPIVTRVNIDRARIRGVEAEAQVRLADAWLAGAHVAATRGSERPTGAALRRIPPPFGGLRLRWAPPRGMWVEGVATFAARQTRLSAGDLGDARIGARRTPASIARFFTGTAADLGLVRDEVLVATGETLAEVQARVLGGSAAAPLYTATPGFLVLGARAGWRVGPRADVTLIGDNLTDRNYRWHGSGVDAPGVNVQLRLRYRF